MIILIAVVITVISLGLLFYTEKFKASPFEPLDEDRICEFDHAWETVLCYPVDDSPLNPQRLIDVGEGEAKTICRNCGCLAGEPVMLTEEALIEIKNQLSRARDWEDRTQIAIFLQKKALEQGIKSKTSFENRHLYTAGWEDRGKFDETLESEISKELETKSLKSQNLVSP